MGFLFPAFLAGALAIVVPVILHLRRRDAAPEVPFTAVRLLRQQPIEQIRRRRLRDALLLAARVLALLLFAAAFARPYVAGAAAEGSLWIVALDRSFSMDAPGQLDRALALAHEVIDSAPRRDRIAVVAFDEQAEVLAEPGTASQARAALERLQVGQGTTRYAPLVARAVELAGGGGTASLAVIGDMQRAGWDGVEPVQVPDSLAITLHDVGLPAANAAVTSVRAGEAGITASVEVWGEPFSGTARLLVDGQVVARTELVHQGAGAVQVFFEQALPAAGAVSVEIDDHVGYAADNSRFLVLDPAPASRVLLVGAEAADAAYYVKTALESAGSEHPFEVRSASTAALARMNPEDWSRTTAVLVSSTRQLDRHARDAIAAFVEGGGGLLVTASPHVDPPTLAGMRGWTDLDAAEAGDTAATVAATDLRHPIFSPFGALIANLGQVRFSRHWRVGEDGWDVVARFSNGAPALLERPHAEGRVLLFASDLERRWNDFPLHPAFVPFVVECVRYVGARRDSPREYRVGSAPPEIGREAGVFSAADGRRVAVNVDLRESSLYSLSEEEFSAMVPSRPAERLPGPDRTAVQVEAGQNLWRYGLLLMLGLLVAESLVGRGR